MVSDAPVKAATADPPAASSSFSSSSSSACASAPGKTGSSSRTLRGAPLLDSIKIETSVQAASAAAAANFAQPVETVVREVGSSSSSDEDLGLVDGSSFVVTRELKLSEITYVPSLKADWSQVDLTPDERETLVSKETRYHPFGVNQLVFFLHRTFLGHEGETSSSSDEDLDLVDVSSLVVTPELKLSDISHALGLKAKRSQVEFTAVERDALVPKKTRDDLISIVRSRYLGWRLATKHGADKISTQDRLMDSMPDMAPHLLFSVMKSGHEVFRMIHIELATSRLSYRRGRNRV
jgi:hypothetical protein